MKRGFDFLVSLISIVILSPLMMVTAILIKITSKGPVLFKQTRIGKNNVEFNIYKFRTMRVETPNVATHLLSNTDSFYTPIGKQMRSVSLDELPQLFNILKGEMSLVGPRPALYNQYDLKEMRTNVNVHKLMPGLTGWAQINGRDELTLEDKVRRDEEYMEMQSFFMDMKIIFQTALKVIVRHGIQEGEKEDNNEVTL